MDSTELDFSKENIQPVKEGRIASYLSTALNSQCHAKSQSELLKEREKFELALRKYKGDDPLEVWYNYINWVIQAYPSNEVADLTTLIHKCLAKFKDDERYHQDVRYVKLWIKCVEMQRDPFETYDMIHKHGIGSKCAEFYKSWAEEYEKIGDFKQASKIYAKGFDYGAQPASDLAKAQRNFEDRVARHFATKPEDEWMASNSGSDGRRVLSALAPVKQGRDENVGSLRTGAAIAGSAGVLKQSRGLQLQQKPPPLQIFTDQQVGEARNTVHLDKVPLGRAHDRENTRKPGKWTIGGSAKRPAPAVATTPLASSLPFKISEDPPSGKGISTPGGLCYSQNVFKQRKVERDDFDCPLAIFEPPDPTKKVMYCKEKVYSGGNEFSLEEIRAIRYFEAAEEEKKKVATENQENKLSSQSDENAEGGQSLDLMEDLSTRNNNFVTPSNKGKYGNRQEVFHEGRPKGPSSYHPSPMQQFDFMSAPSPTINTRAANAMMNELFSTTFTQCLGDSLLVMPQEPQPSAPKFEIPCDDNATFPDLPDKEEMLNYQMPKAPFSIHCSENILFEQSPLNDENNCKSDEAEEVDKNWGAHIPFVPPPKDEENFGGDDDSSKENCCPNDYQPPATKEKRPLAGILLPSRNVPFKPLEEEDYAEEKEDDVKDVNAPDNATENNGDHHKATSVKRQPPSHRLAWETSFENEMYKCLNDVAKSEVPTLNKEMDDENEVGFSCSKSFKTMSSSITKKSSGGIIFKQTSTMRMVETEIASDSRHGHESNSNPLSRAPLCSQGRDENKPMFNERGLWGGGLSAQPLAGPCETPNSDGPETVENPTDQSMLESLLGKVALPVSRSSNFYRITQSIPYLKTNDAVNLRRGLKLTIQRVIGSTPDAKLYLALNSEGEPIVIKYQHVSCEWEFYIVREIRSRLEDPRMFSAFSNILEGYLFNADSSMMMTKYLPNGSFIDLLNAYKKKHVVFPEVLALFFTIDIVNSVRVLHGCNVIHGSIRPENLLIGDVPDVSKLSWNDEQFRRLLPVLQLINMGKCIDMTLFPRNVCFKSTSQEDQHQCIEMQNGKPWTYQIDLYGIAFTMHCMIFGEFMDISCQNGIWNINRKVPSHFNSGIWNNLFHSLLNVPSCDYIPDLLSIQAKLQEFMFTFEVDEFMSAIAFMKRMLEELHRKESNKITFKCV
ncbi:mitotic checkpoint serine/threonine-protein kinase BUB1-like [Ischnura elegans]|uniref:mitotic checkpoint serine/threonine-protein kinase BUB1-like n=1 Tax=Ischnura elegans TaxID=197161 RepID=UPI001ED894CB|nr:mitotic checkpoint serine/threonine-protein kinase BUB1-like [Ischnura elegans]